jgi:hypothetical protein
MNKRIKELRKQVKVDMHLHNVEDIKAMQGCFGFEGGNKIVNDYIEKFAELIVRECLDIVNRKEYSYHEADPLWETSQLIKEHFGVEE